MTAAIPVLRRHPGGRVIWDRALIRYVEEERAARVSAKTLAERLDIPYTTFVSNLHRLGLVRVACGGSFNARELAGLFGFRGGLPIIRWIELGMLRGRNVHGVGWRGRQWVVEEEDLFAFVEDPRWWNCWDPARMPDGAMREWAMEVRAACPPDRRWWTAAQIARHFLVNWNTAWHWIDLGLLPSWSQTPHVRLVRGDHVLAFTPPCVRMRTMTRRREWEAREEEILVRGVRAGETFTALGQRLHRSPTSCRSHFHLLLGGLHHAGLALDEPENVLTALAGFQRLGGLDDAEMAELLGIRPGYFRNLIGRHRAPSRRVLSRARLVLLTVRVHRVHEHAARTHPDDYGGEYGERYDGDGHRRDGDRGDGQETHRCGQAPDARIAS